MVSKNILLEKLKWERIIIYFVDEYNFLHLAPPKQFLHKDF